MNVRRFMNRLWLRVTTFLGGARRRSMEQKAREPVLIGASSPASSQEQPLPSLALSSWLDNGRRLRPRLRLAPRETREIRATRETGASTTRPLRHKTQPATTPAPVEAPAPRVSMAPPASMPPEQPPAPVASPMPPAIPSVPVTSAAAEQSDDLSELERLDAETRRLMLLRRLVRQRVFNEGFTGDDIPAQYRRSHGMEPPSPCG